MKKITLILSGAAVCAGLCLSAMTANAATPDEAAELARQYGYSEDLIQQGWNEFNAHPELYPPEVIDSYMDILKQSGNTIVTNVPYNPDAQIPTVTTAAPVQADSSGGDSQSQSDRPADNSITLQCPDGSEINRVSKEQFINWSYEEKMTYLSTFPEEQQTVIIKNLAPEEYKSMLKQLPADQKLSIIGDAAAITDDMGLNLSVDKITDDNIVLSMTNKDGELVAVSSAKDTVENTGYDRRGIFALIAALLAGGIAGMLLLAKKCFGKDDIGV